MVEPSFASFLSFVFVFIFAVAFLFFRFYLFTLCEFSDCVQVANPKTGKPTHFWWASLSLVNKTLLVSMKTSGTPQAAHLQIGKALGWI